MLRLNDLGRKGHLCWEGGSVDAALLTEDRGPWGSPVQEHRHLQNLPHDDWKRTWSDHVPSWSAEDHFRDSHANFSDDSLLHMRAYKSSSFHINTPLRQADRVGGTLKLKVRHWNPKLQPDHYAKRMREIQGVEGITDNNAPEAMHVYRGIQASSGIHKLAPGKMFVDHGFTGTSFKPHQAVEFSGAYHDQDHTVPPDVRHRVLMAKIHVPAGGRGHYLDADPESFHQEHEFLLHRGTQFRIDRHSLIDHPDLKFPDDSGNEARGRSGVHMIHMTAIGSHPKDIINPHIKPATAVDHFKLMRGFRDA